MKKNEMADGKQGVIGDRKEWSEWIDEGGLSQVSTECRRIESILSLLLCSL